MQVYHKHTILIVDDESDIRTICANIIARSFEMVVVQAGSLEEAKRHVQNSPPDFAIIDLNLPDGSGLDLVDDLKCANNKVKFIFISAHNQCIDRANVKNCGGFFLIPKPFKAEDITLSLQSMMQSASS